MMKRQEHGFTILELMIATLIFSTILISITMGVMYFTKSYYRGVYAASTQDAARSISEQIAQAIQFSGSAPTLSDPAAKPGYICAGATEFVYFKGTESDGSVGSGMYAAPMSSGTCIDPTLITTTKKQLLSKNMRLANLTVNMSGSLYTIDVTVAYGDNDLLCVPSSTTASCTSTAVPADLDLVSNDLTCRLTTGSEFCAVSHLQTTVERRL